ncbi:DUF5996 family protein [Lentiprolixibacter aurantiacus]|uniref:DUF5996 family protein n=1 Tax=Lentiprolixibacter aurantiacus TaxID=2993939 RepID=A0AAE3SMP6_9FLAO|nr:DUF5996 family protein [Lentiprolixibacter aurantiacus]MCX2718799.1 DUF5996 family protein [Lentiprolixibacter aurantiacus]
MNSSLNPKISLPELPFEDWANTRLTVHLILQIIGKTRLKLTPRKNHWWYITIYITSRGFGTGGIPIVNGMESLEIEFNIPEKAVSFDCSSGQQFHISLKDSPSIAQFYSDFRTILKELDLHPEFVEKPFDLNIETPFAELTTYHHYDWDFINRFWQVMRWNQSVFQEFSGRFYGKTCPVHIYWHHMDLTVTRFSGKKLPAMDASARLLEKDTYSHEQISFGFWVGDDMVREPMYYSYTYPSPDKLDQEPLLPVDAQWVDSNGSPMALLSYDSVRRSEDPREAVLAFLESAYQSGAKLANWPVEDLTVPKFEDL